MLVLGFTLHPFHGLLKLLQSYIISAINQDAISPAVGTKSRNVVLWTWVGKLLRYTKLRRFSALETSLFEALKQSKTQLRQ